CLQYNRASFTF
nr:immunoglobulin light chain junction region [Macaca mulatta]